MFQEVGGSWEQITSQTQPRVCARKHTHTHTYTRRDTLSYNTNSLFKQLCSCNLLIHDKFGYTFSNSWCRMRTQCLPTLHRWMKHCKSSTTFVLKSAMCKIYTALQMFLVQFSTHQLLCFMVKRSERTQKPRRESSGEKAPRADGLAVNQELGGFFVIPK